MPLAPSYKYSPATRKAAGHKLLRYSDGDTLVVEQPIRLVSCDTPEKAAYAGKPEVSQPKLDKCKQRLEDGFYDAIPAKLRKYLIKKLTNDAAQRHIDAATEASAAFDALLDRRLTRPDGKLRKTAILPTGEIIDTYGRMLAYVSPWFDGAPNDPIPPVGDPERNTLNLDMIAAGYAAFFPVYPSLPKLRDMQLAVKAAENAWDKKLGVWKTQGDDLLLGYEFRACIKLAAAPTAAEGIKTAFQRLCVDLRDMNMSSEFSFCDVPPSLRLWVWEKDRNEAKQVLGLT